MSDEDKKGRAVDAAHKINNNTATNSNASKNETHSTQDSQRQPAAAGMPRRTRRSRGRVTRVAGAAGAALPVVVSSRSEKDEPVSVPEPHEKPDRARQERLKALADEIFTDKGIPSPQSSSSSSSSSSSISDRPRPTSSADSPAPALRRLPAKPAMDSLFSASSADDDKTRAIILPPAKPMTSLLFQAPVLTPASHNSHNKTGSSPLDQINTLLDEKEEEKSQDRGDSSHSSRRRRKDRDHRDSHYDHSDRSDRTSRGNADTDFSEDESEEELRQERHSKRRLNAQERRAAAEVEQIEEDLSDEDISYRPIEDGFDQVDDDVDEELNDSGNGRSSERSRSHQSDRQETETTVRRRRRRRNRNSSDQQEEQIPRSRKQQYIDKITGIEGSTRLEAKRQRRRDNRRERSRHSLVTEQDFLARRENVDRLMVVRERGRHSQVSVIEDNVLVEHYISDIEEVSSVGNIYQGRVQNVLPSMEAAFVDIGQYRNGVLYAGEVNWDTTRLEGQPRLVEHAFRPGDNVLVQVTKDPIGHKGARLTAQITVAGRYLVLVPAGGITGVSRKLPERERTRLKNIVSKIAPDNMGVIIRTAADGASEEAIQHDLEHLVKKWENVEKKLKEYQSSKRPHLLQGEPDVVIRVIRDIFNDDFKKLVVEGDSVYNRIKEYLEEAAPDMLDRLEKWDPEEHEGKDVFDKWSIDSQLRKGMERKVYLPSGGSLIVDRTEAMTTIDVNTGRFIGKGQSLEATVTKCNLEAAEEIVRQLRLRDIGGMIMIDFVDMVMPQNRDLVLRRLVECLSRDRTKHQVAEVTSLGLVQMTRKRVGQGLVEAFSEECPTCSGRGFILHTEPTVSADFDDPYALKGGDPFIHTNKHGHGHNHYEETDANAPQGSTPQVKATLARIAAAAAEAAEADKTEEGAETNDQSANQPPADTGGEDVQEN